MKKSVVILLTGLLIPVLSIGQIMDRVPKQYSLEAGYRYVVSSEFENQAPQGYTAIFDYAWQLSGFDKKKASYITVPIGYTVMPGATPSDSRVSIVSYGWTVRHELAKDKNIIPFLGYALLLNQYHESNYPGRVFGHQTRFAFGANFMQFGKLIPYTKLEYSMTNYPIWGEDGSRRYNFISLKLGIRYSKKS